MNTPRIGLGLGLGSGLGNIISRTVNETSQAPKPTYVSNKESFYLSLNKTLCRTFHYPLYLYTFIRNSFNKPMKEDFLSIRSTTLSVPNELSNGLIWTIPLLLMFQDTMDMMMISKEITVLKSEYNWTEERLMDVIKENDYRLKIKYSWDWGRTICSWVSINECRRLEINTSD